MDDFEKLKGFLTATNLHASEGVEFGLSRGDVAKMMLAFGIGVHLQAHGTAATVETLRAQAAKLENGDGQADGGE